MGRVPSRGCSRGNDSLMFLSPSLPLPLKKNTIFKKIKRGYFKKEKEPLRAKNVYVVGSGGSTFVEYACGKPVGLLATGMSPN